MLLALQGAGWTLEALPAEPVSARRGDDTLAPHLAIHQLREGELSGEAWRERVEELGRRPISTLGVRSRYAGVNETRPRSTNRGLAHNLLDFLPLPNFLGGRGD